MRKEINIKKIVEYFSRFQTEINALGSIGLYDLHKVAENFLIPILSPLFNCQNLVNLNTIEDNFPAIDLGCNVSKISFQITATKESPKIIKTLEKFRDHKLHLTYGKVFVLILTGKQKSYTSEKLIKLAKELNFDIRNNIIDLTDLIKIIQEKSIEISDSILNTLSVEFEKITKYEEILNQINPSEDISSLKIANEKKSKKYIPEIFGESFCVKDDARIFSHPQLFINKIYDEENKIDLSVINNVLTRFSDKQLSFNRIQEINIPNANLINIHEIADQIKVEMATRVADLENISKADQFQKRTSDYKVNKYAFPNEIRYILDTIKIIKKGAELVNKTTFLITSQAGQGKTNFLCDFTENFCFKHKIPTIYIPARELNLYNNDHITKYVKNNRYYNQIRDKFELLELCEILSKKGNRPFVFIIDGINEVKDSENLKTSLIDFISISKKYHTIKFLITCRSEFYEKKYNYITSDELSDITYRVTDLKEEYTEEQLNHIIDSYFSYFNIDINLSKSARELLLSDLLLLRIFSESNTNKKDNNILYIYKAELFEKYVIDIIAQSFDTQHKKELVNTLFLIAQNMLSKSDFSHITIDELNLTPVQNDIVNKLVDDDIILRRELPTESLFDLGTEKINFTYDEMRDFILSYYLVNLKDLDKANFYFEMISNTQTHEGVLKYVYLLSRSSKNSQWLDQISTLKQFNDLYVISIPHLNHKHQNENDNVIVNKILNDEEDRGIITRLSVYLFKCRDMSRHLSIKTLNEHLLSLSDDRLIKFFSIIFDDHYYSFSRQRSEEVDKYSVNFLRRLTNDNIDIENGLFVFSFIVLSQASWKYRNRFVDLCNNLDYAFKENVYKTLHLATPQKVISLLSEFMEK
ncbi:SMEK domain-containing protein [Citrobacter freundii]|nr:SMEK domain-containing protein [Citrobacter freundii]